MCVYGNGMFSNSHTCSIVICNAYCNKVRCHERCCLLLFYPTILQQEGVPSNMLPGMLQQSKIDAERKQEQEIKKKKQKHKVR